MADSDDDLIICTSTDLPTKEWPTDEEINEIVERIVTDFAEQGNDPSDLKLRSVLKRFNDCGFTGNFMVSFWIKINSFED